MNEDDEILAEDMLAVSAEIAAGFPPPRACTELVLLDVNPHRAHAFWNIEAGEFLAARQRTGAAAPPLVIRLHDVTGIVFDGKNPHDTFDVGVGGLQGQTDVDVRKDGRTYVGELGFRRSDGHLERLAISQPMDLPRAPVLAAHALAAKAAAPADETRIAAAARIEMAGLAENEDAVVSPVAAPVVVGPWPDADELLLLLPPRAAAVAAWYEITGSPSSAISVAQKNSEAEMDGVSDDVEPEPLRLPPVEPKAGGVGRALQEAVPNDPPSLNSDTTLAETFSSATQMRQPVRLEDFLSYSSHNLGRAEAGVDLHVEVLIHGRVPPGRRATLFDRAVPVDDDGHFALRHELLHPGPLLPYLAPALPPDGG